MKPAMNFGRQTRRTIALPPLLIGLLAAVYFGLVSHLLSVLKQVDQTDRLIARAYGTSARLIDMEAGLRGYLLAGSPEFLPPYREASSRIGTDLDELARLVADDPEQSIRLAMVRKQTRQWCQDASEAIALRDGPSWSDRGREAKARGEKTMEAIRGGMAEFLDAEEDYRDHCRRAAQARSWTILGSCSGVAISLGIIVAYVSRRQLASLSATFEAALDDLRSQVDRQERERLALLSEAMKYYAIFMLDAEGRVTTWSTDGSNPTKVPKPS